MKGTSMVTNNFTSNGATICYLRVTLISLLLGNKPQIHTQEGHLQTNHHHLKCRYTLK